MADTGSDETPEEASRQREKAAEATDENSGLSIEGDTPPAEGSSVGPTNDELDVDQPGDRARGPIWVVLILVFVGLFLLMFIGRLVGMF